MVLDLKNETSCGETKERKEKLGFSSGNITPSPDICGNVAILLKKRTIHVRVIYKTSLQIFTNYPQWTSKTREIIWKKPLNGILAQTEMTFGRICPIVIDIVDLTVKKRL